MRRILAVAVLVLGACGGSESDVPDEVAAWCADFCGEVNDGACWSEAEGGRTACIARCDAVAPDAEMRDRCSDLVAGCDYGGISECMRLAPPSLADPYFGNACQTFCDVTAPCRDASLAGHAACLDHCTATAPDVDSPDFAAYCDCEHAGAECDPLFTSRG